MSMDGFIPEVWGARLLANLHTTLVYGQPGVINQDYEGEIREYGDTVRIGAIGAVTVRAYAKNTDMATPETLDDAQGTLSIDQAYYFNFQIDDVDRAQARPALMDGAMAEAAQALGDQADQHLAGLYTQVASSNWIGSDASPKTGYTASDVYEYLVDLKVILDRNNTPRAGRFCIVPPFVEGWLLKDDRFVRSGTPAGDARLMNGEVGQAAGFRILCSNNVPYATSTTKYRVLAGHPMAWTWAHQVRDVEAYRPELRFADAVKGLHLYGARVIRPEAMAGLVINAA